MVKDLITNWFSDNKVKINSPVLGAFIGAWVIFNWKHFLLLFWGDGTLDSRLITFEKALTFSNYSIWLWPLLLALGYAFILPYLNILTQKILGHADKLRHQEVINLDVEKAKQKAALNEEVYKADPANPYLGRKLEAELKQKEAAAEKARADADKAEAERKEAVARQETAEAEAKEAKAKEAEIKRKEERDQQAHELSKAKHIQEVSNRQFPTLYLLINMLAKSLRDDEECLPLDLLAEAIAKCFGYDDFNALLADDAFTLSELEELACVVYDDSKLLSDLKAIIKAHQVAIDEGQLFDHLLDIFEELDKFPFIPSSSMEDIAKEYIEDTGNFYDLVHSDAVSGPVAETNANDFTLEYAEFEDIQQASNGEYVADVSAVIQGEHIEDKPFAGNTINANFQLVYKPVIGRNGFATPEIEEIEASLKSEY